MTAKTFTLEFLSEQTLVTDGLEYSSDEDGNMSIHQENMFITLTPKQALDLKELLSAHLDTLKLRIKFMKFKHNQKIRCIDDSKQKVL